MRGIVLGLCTIGLVWNGMVLVYHIDGILNGEPGHLAPALVAYVSAFLCGYGAAILKGIIR